MIHSARQYVHERQNATIPKRFGNRFRPLVQVTRRMI
jgi:hypothetical protein